MTDNRTVRSPASVVDVVIELGDERFGAPGRQFAAGTADALRSYPSAGGCDGLHALVQQRRRRSDVTAAHPRDSEVRASNAALHLIARCDQVSQGSFEVLVGPLGSSDMQLADTFETTQPITVEPAAR